MRYKKNKVYKLSTNYNNLNQSTLKQLEFEILFDKFPP